ncbi:hypothetical protein CPT_Moonbeam49 [Bacillus phage Moonbeam]|uniref:Uncharacterized protein n=1 Tax=Bacillus phage Moonbeam TaxID=1540091 RepID=A0A0A0RN53_9CAUD|nr:hypothetical protein CPT_Moonbeam49 [Bacillus phage Moonbeam]AIW03447.1 hypothetical protein CPT_Moonbeam49 [Bacillus phage Moonbeam]
MKIYLVLFQIASDLFGYHNAYVDEVEAMEESKRMNNSEKGKCYHYFVKVKKTEG